MEPDDHRTVVVCFSRHDGAPRFGAGRLLDKGLVLTAAYLVDPAKGDGEVYVRLLDDPRFRRCSVVWHRYDHRTSPGERLDAALLRIDDSDLWQLPELPPVRWGRLVTRRPATPVRVGALADCTDECHGERAHQRPHSLTGVVDPGSAVKARRHLITLDESSADRWHGVPPTRYGVTGAAVLCHGLLIGVVAEPQRGSTQDRWLSTVPVHNLALAPGFLAAVGPTEIEAAELQPVLAGDPPMIDCPPDESYANTQLLTWLEDPTWFSVRLLTGDHAARRMWARQLVALMRTWGWSAGFLSERATPHGMSIVGQVTTGLLLVVERADTRGRQTAELLDVLGRRPGRDSARYGAAPVRMLLSAPAAEDWWEELRSDALLLRDLPAGTVVRLPGR